MAGCGKSRIDEFREYPGIRVIPTTTLGQMTSSYCGQIRHRLGIGLWVTLVSSLALLESEINAREFRVSQMPNGAVFSCGTCHISPGGSGPLNAFGNAVSTKIVGSPGFVAFWDSALAAQDSDGDGFTNGQELGDPDGDFLNIGSSALVTNPGNLASKPNSAPNFTSTAVLTAAIGTAYSYTATASDPDGHSLTFSKIAGPSWLSVAANGAVTGTPLEADTGAVSITIRATDNGSPSATRDQTYTLTVRATFAGWQALRFTLPGEAGIAAANADPDNDGISNLFEYARRLNPKSSDNPAGNTRGFNGNGQFVLTVQVRDDAPGLTMDAEISSALPFANITTVNGQLTDPTPNDGFRTATFTDPVSKENVTARFIRLKVITTE